jgi:hypothetical protein
LLYLANKDKIKSTSTHENVICLGDVKSIWVATLNMSVKKAALSNAAWRGDVLFKIRHIYLN